MSKRPSDVHLDKLRRIIVIRLGALGDVVRTIPAVQALRAAAPRARIAWLVDDRCAPILEGLRYVNELLVVPRRALRAASRNPFAWARWMRTWRAFCRRLETWRADAVFDFHGLFKTAVLTRRTRAPLRIGYVRGHSKEHSWRAYNVLIDPGPVKIPRLERNLALVEHCGGKRITGPPELPFSERDKARIDSFLSSVDASRVAALIPGSSRSRRHKRWPATHFGALTDLLSQKLGLMPLVVTGPGEEALADEIRMDARSETVNAPPVSQKELAVLLGRCQCCIGGDTGPMHIASLMGTPVVVIIGPTDPVQNRPLPFSPWRLVAPETDESRAPRRMGDVSPGQVIDAVASVLEEAEAGQTGSGA